MGAWKSGKVVNSHWVFRNCNLKMAMFLVKLLNRSVFETAPCTGGHMPIGKFQKAAVTFDYRWIGF
jgi:hypothetical protein